MTQKLPHRADRSATPTTDVHAERQSAERPGAAGLGVASNVPHYVPFVPQISFKALQRAERKRLRIANRKYRKRARRAEKAERRTHAGHAVKAARSGTVGGPTRAIWS